MNKVILLGRLTKDPEIRYGQVENSVVARYTLAVDRRFKQEEQQTADFIGCVTFGRQAEFAERYLRQGMKIAITGRIQTGSYKKDGQTIYTTDVIVEEQEFAESKKQEVPQANPSAYTQPQMPADSDGFMSIPDGIDEELPFA